MKRKLPLALAFLALGLAACGGAGESSSVSSSGVPSSSSGDTVSSLPSSESSSEPSSSIEPSSSDPSTSNEPEPEKGWTAPDLSIIEEVVGNHELPYHDFSADGYAYTLVKAVDTDGMSYLSLRIEDFAYEDMAKVVSTWIGKGETFIDATSLYQDVPVGMKILNGTYGDGSRLEVQLYLTEIVFGRHSYIDEGSGYFWLDVYPLALATDNWEKALETLNFLIESTLSLDPISLPEPTNKPEGYLVETVQDAFLYEYPQLRMNGVGDSSYLDQLVSSGWLEIPDYSEEGRYFASPDGSIGTVASFADSNLYLEFLRNTYFSSWPSERIAENVAVVANPEAVSLPTLPETNFIDQVETIEIYDEYIYFGSFYIYLNGGDWADDYIALLVKAGFEDVNYYYGAIEYSDPERALLVSVSYDLYSDYTGITVSAGSSEYLTSWPTEEVARILLTLGGTVGVVPEPSFLYDYVYINENIEEESYEISVKTVGSDGSLIDTRSSYEAQLNAENSGWTYDSFHGLWHNGDEKVSLSLSFSDGDGLIITLKAYVPFLDSWPEEDVASAITDIELVTSAGIIPFVGGSGYQLEVGTDYYGEAYYFKVNVIGVTSEEHLAYEESLASAGWESSSYMDSKVWYVSDGSLLLSMAYDSENQSLVINFYNVDKTVWGRWEAYISDIAGVFRMNDSSFVLPVPTVPEGTLAYVDDTNYRLGSMDFYLFDTGILESYGAQLVEVGWKENSAYAAEVGADSAYSFSGNSSWNLYIEVDVPNNVTHVYVGMA